MKNFLKIFIAIVICLLCACQDHGQESANVDMPPVETESSMGENDTGISEVSFPTIQLEDGSKFSYIIVRREQTVLSRQDSSVCSSMYYEMPVVLILDEEMQGYVFDKEFQWYGGNNDEHAEIAAINAVFEQKCREFFENAAEFTLLSQDLATHHTGERGRYHNELETQVIHCDESIFSVRQVLHWGTYGLQTWSEFGLTFSLGTGELLGLDDFINMDYDTFHKIILDFLFDHISSVDWRMDMKRDFYGDRDIFNDFSDHRFYYKDGSLYIIFPALSNENDWVVRWSVADSMPIECLCGASICEEDI